MIGARGDPDVYAVGFEEKGIEEGHGV